MPAANSMMRECAVAGGMKVRRITPLEAERLMGLPDNWTAVSYHGKPMADGPRYRLIGKRHRDQLSALGRRADRHVREADRMTVNILVGDAREQLRTLPDESVHMVMTSPPYWGLRSYGGEMTWEGGDPACAHDAGKTEHQKQGATSIRPGRSNVDAQRNDNHGRSCLKCGAVPRYNGMIGLEETLDQHLENLVEVFREVRRVLRKDGTLWLNYGSMYARGNGKMGWSESGGTMRGLERRHGSGTTRFHQRQSALACDSGGTGLLGCPQPDCVCSGLCGGCQDAIRSRHGHTADTLPPPEQSPQPAETTGHDSERSDCSPLSPSPPDAPESNKLQSSPPPPGACSGQPSPATSGRPSVDGSSPPGAPESACKGCGAHIPDREPPSDLSACRKRGMGLSSTARGSYSIASHKPKDLIDMPGYVAEALRADGWWLRDDIIIAKSNPMPESTKDRPTRAHEFLFLMTPAPHYFYDSEAVKEPVSGTANARAAKHNTAEARRGKTREGTKSVSTAERRGMTPAKPASWANSPHYQNHDPRYPKRTGQKTPKDVDGRSARLGRAPGWRERAEAFPDPRFETRYKRFDRPPGVTPKSAPAGSGIRQNESYQAAMVDMTATRNLRDVWDIDEDEYQQFLQWKEEHSGALTDVWKLSTKPYKGTHYATFSPALVERPIKAGTSEHGVCPDCGAPWERLFTKKLVPTASWSPDYKGTDRTRMSEGESAGSNLARDGHIPGGRNETNTIGFRPTCACYDERYRGENPEPKGARKRRQRAAWGGRWKRVRARPGNPEWPVDPCRRD